MAHLRRHRFPVYALLAFTLLCTSVLVPASASAAPTSIDTTELAFVQQLNRFRVARKLTPLRIDAKLTAAATWHAADMGRKSYFSHTDSYKRDPFRRMAAFGYPGASTWRGENIAAGNATVAATYRQWLHSPPHRANWTKSQFRAIGIARVHVPGSRYGWYWVTTFGSKFTSRAR